MSRILYVTTKESIEISFPDWLKPFMSYVCKYLRFKVINRRTKIGRTAKHVIWDEATKIDYSRVKNVMEK